jgi:hypothetical protein
MNRGIVIRRGIATGSGATISSFGRPVAVASEAADLSPHQCLLVAQAPGC